MNEAKPSLAFMVGDQLYEHELVGRHGYNATQIPGAIRVWDEKSTWVVPLERLVYLNVSELRGRG